jgi:SAM-dependent MidA family methyltransferase
MITKKQYEEAYKIVRQYEWEESERLERRQRKELKKLSKNDSPEWQDMARTYTNGERALDQRLDCRNAA